MDYYDYGTQAAYAYPQMRQQVAYPYQPQFNAAPMVNQNDNRFMWIQGKEAAKAYPVSPNRTVFFLDDKDAYAYLKKTDAEGKTSEFKVFQLIEEKEPATQVVKESNYITKAEFTSFTQDVSNSLNELKQMILSSNKQNKPYKKEVRNDG